MAQKLDRREFLQAATAAAAAYALASCKPEIVEKEVTRVVQATAEPTAAATPAPIEVNINMALNRGDIGSGGDLGCSGGVHTYFSNYLMYAGLVRLNQDLEPTPDMAESWTINDVGDVYTFKLKPNLKWSDGTPITAHDYEWTIKRNLDNKLWCAGWFWQLADIKGARAYYTGESTDPDTVMVKALDDLTLEVQLEYPAGFWIMVVTLPTFMAIPRAAVERALEANGEGIPQDWWKPPHAVYSGPFKCVQWITDLRFYLEANENYHFGRPKIDKLNVHMLQNAATIMAAYEADEIDLVDVPETEYLRVVADPELSAQMVSNSELMTQHLVWDAGVKATEDPRVRQAIACAIDRETLCNDVLPGIGTPAYQFLPPGLLGYDGVIGTELKYNPDKAKKLMADAGFSDLSTFPELLLQYAAGNVMFQTMFEGIQAMIQESLGIKVTLVPGEQTSMGVKLADLRYNTPLLWRQLWGADFPDSHNFMSAIYTCPPPQAAAWEHPERVLCSRKFDELVWAAAAESDPAKRTEIYKQCEQELIIDNPFIIPLYYAQRHRLIKPWLKDVFVVPLSFVQIRENTYVE